MALYSHTHYLGVSWNHNAHGQGKKEKYESSRRWSGAGARSIVLRLGGHQMDQEMRDALRKFVAAMAGEKEIAKLMKEEDTYTDNWGNTLPEGVKTREEVIDFLVGMSEGIQRFFKEYHAEHETYPEPIDHSKLPPSPTLKLK
jgi:hypothetical protein